MPKADKNLPAHHVEPGDSKIDGPYLTDERAKQEDNYRKVRMSGNKKKGKSSGGKSSK